jgi:hypothetical protein
MTKSELSAASVWFRVERRPRSRRGEPLSFEATQFGATGNLHSRIGSRAFSVRCDRFHLNQNLGDQGGAEGCTGPVSSSSA